MTDQSFSIILLAAQRTGVTNPLAIAHQVSHKCLIPIVGISLIERMFKILTTHKGCREIIVLIEPDGRSLVEPVAERFRDGSVPITFIESAENIAQSVIMGCEHAAPPFIITTADNVLLSHDSLDRVANSLASGADAVALIASKEQVRAVHPEAQRHFYDFSDGGYANCNLYALSGPKALDAAQIFREGGQFMSNPKRLVTAFGLFNILLMRFKLVSLDKAMQRLSRRFGLRFEAVRPKDGTQAVDVDNERTYNIVEMVLKGELPK